MSDCDPSPTAWKNIVIIGASFAGHTLANRLANKLPSDYRVALIERTPFAVHLPALVRGVTIPGSHKSKLTAPLAQDTIFKDGSRHRLLAPVSVVELREHSVVLDTEFEGSTELPCARCVYAVGSDQAVPLRPAPGCSLREYRALLSDIQGGIADSSSVLIIGGGACGVEIAGEITSHFPEKKVTLVHSHDRLLATAASLKSPDAIGPGEYEYAYKPIPVRLSETLHAQLAARGADIILSDRVVFPDPDGNCFRANTAVAPTETRAEMKGHGAGAGDRDGAGDELRWTGRFGRLDRLETVTLRSGRTVRADNVVLSVGNRPNSGLMAKFAPEAITSTGHVAVDRELRVVPATPSSSISASLSSSSNSSSGSGSGSGSDSRPARTQRYYALGDVSSTPGRKTASQANGEAHQLASILLNHIRDYENGREEKKRPRRLLPVHVTVVTLGDGVVRTADGKPRPGDGIGAGSFDLGWFGIWRAPLFLVRWFAKDYLADQTFYIRFLGSRKVTGEETGDEDELQVNNKARA